MNRYSAICWVKLLSLLENDRKCLRTSLMEWLFPLKGMQGDKKMEGMCFWPPLTLSASFLLTDFHYFHQKDYKGSRHYSIDVYQPSQKCVPYWTSFPMISWRSTLSFIPIHFGPVLYSHRLSISLWSFYTNVYDTISSLLICRVYVWAHLEY
jgi:hypothetical protein